MCFCWWLAAGLGVTDFQVGDEKIVVCADVVVLVVALLVVVNAVVKGGGC